MNFTAAVPPATLPATYYDGKSAVQQPATVYFGADGAIVIYYAGIYRRHLLGEVQISPRLANTPRRMRLPGGALCEIADNDAVDSALAVAGAQQHNRLLHRLESRGAYALLALVCTLLLVFAFVEWGAPALARGVVAVLPPQMESALGEQGLELLDKQLFADTRLPAAQKRRLQRNFETLSAGLESNPPMQLLFRRGRKVGANAFALPGGTIIITDELVKLAEHEEEIIAVMAHEIGHVQRRHIMRQLAQNSMTAFLLAAVLGDVTSLTGLSAALPTLLVEMKHSRAFELEADAFAAEQLPRVGVSPTRLGDMLERLVQQRGAGGGALHYLSTHPRVEERVAALRRNAQE